MAEHFDLDVERFVVSLERLGEFCLLVVDVPNVVICPGRVQVLQTTNFAGDLQVFVVVLKCLLVLAQCLICISDVADVLAVSRCSGP